MSLPAIRTLPDGGLDLADQHLDQGRLAAARRTDDEGELAAVDLERDPVERHVAARVDDRRVLDRDDRRLAAPRALARRRAAGARRCSAASRRRALLDLRLLSSGMRSLFLRRPRQSCVVPARPPPARFAAGRFATASATG